MKKLFTLFTLVMLLASTTMAQIKLYVHQNDGSLTEFIANTVDSITFSEQELIVDYANGYQYVDMGLPSGLLWATCNIGAKTSTEFGDYFAWGETETKSRFSWDNYKWYEKIDNKSVLTKYCTPHNLGECADVYLGEDDYKKLLELEDDAANSSLGGNWRMPTIAEFEELLDPANTTWCYIMKNGVKGCMVVSRKNGNSIFLPLAGYSLENVTSEVSSIVACYWSSSLYVNYAQFAEFLTFEGEKSQNYNTSRCNGNTIRPVLAKTLDFTIHFDANGAEGEMSDIEAKYAETFIVPECLYENKDIQFKYWTTEADGSGVKYRVGNSVVITEDLTLYAQWGANINGYECVDLGLTSGVLWATHNIFAEKPEDYGLYFTWGETEPLRGVYENKYDGEYSSFELADDAARQNWGGNWRVPLASEIDELIAECTWTWISINNVSGYEVKGPNGNTIFLPAAGGCSHMGNDRYSLYGRNARGYYRGNLRATQSYTTVFTKDNVVGKIEMSQDTYLSIRPVCNNNTEKYTLKFDANGGAGNMASLLLEYAEFKILPSCSFTKEGCSFNGWNTKADGTGTSYANKSQITLTEDITFYAQWK